MKGRGDEKEGESEEGRSRGRPLLIREKAVPKQHQSWFSFPLFLYPLFFFSISLSYRFLCVFGCTNLQRAAGWHGGSQRCQVNVSPLLPSLSLPKSLHNKTRNEQAAKRKHSKGENANARMAVLVMKENDPGYQAPSTRQGQGGQRREKQTAYSPLQSPQLPSLPLHPISLSLCHYSPPVPNLGSKTVGIPISGYWNTANQANIVQMLPKPCPDIYNSVWVTPANQHIPNWIYLCLFAQRKHAAVFLLAEVRCLLIKALHC